MNRVTTAIDGMKSQIADRIASGLTMQDKVDALCKSLDMNFEEYVMFQELKSFAFANDKLTLEEAETIYAYLGGIIDTFNGQPVEVKICLTKIFQELLQDKIAARA